ncbi:hypothetical protein T07_1371 [Trichinella nelsoni]|uniref:Uncharacterized protein n=1 Tax=Trichinella nelsoni TaxID=6336 RepID=A0A0V0S696_9BILA|nr:hypothetical protein T07_1371 [Trichinella nelsoni]
MLWSLISSAFPDLPLLTLEYNRPHLLSGTVTHCFTIPLLFAMILRSCVQRELPSVRVLSRIQSTTSHLTKTTEPEHRYLYKPFVRTFSGPPPGSFVKQATYGQ